MVCNRSSPPINIYNKTQAVIFLIQAFLPLGLSLFSDSLNTRFYNSGKGAMEIRNSFENSHLTPTRVTQIYGFPYSVLTKMSPVSMQLLAFYVLCFYRLNTVLAKLYYYKQVFIVSDSFFRSIIASIDYCQYQGT